jgi:hypothetical protein
VVHGVTLNFKLVPRGEQKRIPIVIAGKLIINVQSMLSHIGEYMIAKELYLQDKVPKDFLSKFDLCIDSTEGSISSSVNLGYELSGNFLDGALRKLTNILSTDPSNYNNLKEEIDAPKYLASLAKMMITLSEDLEDFELQYEVEGEMKGFSFDIEALRKTTRDDTREETMIGTIEVKGESLFLSINGSHIPLIFNGTFLKDDVLKYSGGAACILTGKTKRHGNGTIGAVMNISSVDKLSHLTFTKIVSTERDLKLGEGITAEIGFDRASNMWTLYNDMLEFSTSKQNWDDAVIEFHDHVVFMWEIYAEETKDDLNDEEIDIRNKLLSLKPVPLSDE